MGVDAGADSGCVKVLDSRGVMRLFAKLTGGRASFSKVPWMDAARPPVFSSERALDAAIEAATFSRREPTEDGERIVVFCNALGGSFIHSRQEVERRIMLKFPGLALDEVAGAARFLDDRLAAFMKPIQADTRHKSSWIHGWRYDS
jgi:hypothetical protein